MCSGLKGLLEEKESEGLEKGREKGREEGREEGREQERINAIQRMLNKGYTKEIILELDYTEEEILIAENKLL